MSINTAGGSFNGVDLFMAIIVAALICVGRKDGLVSEIFKLFGAFCAVFITLHYYVRFADFLRVQFFGKDAETEFFAFVLLAVVIFVAFVFISKGWSLILHIKLAPFFDRWGRLTLAVIRSYLIGSLVFLALVVSGHGIVNPLARASVCCMIFQNGALGLYQISYAVLIEKYFPDEKINEEIIDLIVKRKGKITDQ